jgi:hypothetical protein
MKKYKCIANCPELDYKDEPHCSFTEFELDRKREYDEDVELIEYETLTDRDYDIYKITY